MRDARSRVLMAFEVSPARACESATLSRESAAVVLGSCPAATVAVARNNAVAARVRWRCSITDVSGGRADRGRVQATRIMGCCAPSAPYPTMGMGACPRELHQQHADGFTGDRKSTRLNSSHLVIS